MPQAVFDDYSANLSTPWNTLLRKVKRIHDAVHGDIRVTATELAIIDTSQFQRLHFIMQLGPAYLVYPTAKHTRFDHCLGTLFVAQEMIDSINTQEDTDTKIVPEDIFLTRLLGLIHDLAHLPFGHTLEDEGRLFARKQWESVLRQDILFGPIGDIIKTYVARAYKECGRETEGKAKGDELVRRLKDLLVKEESGDVEDLEKPFIADIVGNTICADLLDYLERDLYFTRLPGEYDKRVLSQLTVKDVPNSKGVLKKRLVIRLHKTGKEEIRSDVLTGLLDMLNLRYSLAEKVYYHHAKRAASAMIVKVVACAMKAGVIDEEKLIGLGDEALLYYLEQFRTNSKGKSFDDTAGKNLAACLNLLEKVRRRLLYKPVYELTIVEAKNQRKIRELINDWQCRHDFEERISTVVGLRPDDIIVYIPREDMGAKTAKTIVEVPFDLNTGQRCCMLEELRTEHVPAEYRDIREIINAELQALDTRHRALWKLSVFINPEADSDKKAMLRTICEEWFESKSLFALVDTRASALGKKLTAEQKNKVSGDAVATYARPQSESGHESEFSIVCDSVDTLLKSSG